MEDLEHIFLCGVDLKDLKHQFIKIAVEFHKNALQDFFAGRLSAFDAHVGDASCQIRALYLIDLFHSHDFLQEQMPIEIEKFIYLSYVLNFFKKMCEGCRTILDNAKFMEKFAINKVKANKILKAYQREISILSCEYVLTIARKMNYPHIELLMASKRVGDDRKVLLPCFLVSDVLMRHIKLNQIPYRVYFQFGQKVYYQQKANRFPFIAFHCYATAGEFQLERYHTLLNQFEFLYYLNQAAHSQYCGIKLAKYNDSPFGDLECDIDFMAMEMLYEKCKKEAFTMGCTRENPKVCVIKHIQAGCEEIDIYAPQCIYGKLEESEACI